MECNWVIWKKVMCKSRRGLNVHQDSLELIDVRLRRTLLSRILAMPKQKSIGIDTAIRLAAEKQMEAFDAGKFGEAPGHYSWYDLNFVEWISGLGFHIELTGEEFEVYLCNRKSMLLS